MAGTAEGRVSLNYDKKGNPEPPKHKLEEYQGSKTVPAGHGTVQNPDPTKTPAVPKSEGSGSHETSVHTPSMDVFASNIEQLVAPVKKAQQVLNGVSVAPGAFYHANLMRQKVSGSGGLKDTYSKVLDDLADGLTDLCSGVRNLSKQYSTTEEANKLTAKELEESMHSANSDFGALGNDSSRLS